MHCRRYAIRGALAARGAARMRRDTTDYTRLSRHGAVRAAGRVATRARSQLLLLHATEIADIMAIFSTDPFT